MATAQELELRVGDIIRAGVDNARMEDDGCVVIMKNISYCEWMPVTPPKLEFLGYNNEERVKVRYLEGHLVDRLELWEKGYIVNIRFQTRQFPEIEQTETSFKSTYPLFSLVQRVTTGDLVLTNREL